MTLARIKFGKLKEYELKLSKLGDNIEDIAGKAIYVGAGTVADEVRTQMKALSTTTEELAMLRYRQKRPTYPTARAKEGLLTSFYISEMEQDSDGFWYVKLGFAGYNEVVTKKYTKGQPNQMVARSIESGSSAMYKQPFIRKAIQASRKKAESRMEEILEKEIEKNMGG